MVGDAVETGAVGLRGVGPAGSPEHAPSPSSAGVRGRPASSDKPLPVSLKCITLVPVQFSWDPAKAISNLKKHGVSFAEAVTVFGDPLALVLEDAVYEERTILVGQSENHRVLFTVFVEVSENSIRIISARRATSHERRSYEEGAP